MSVMAFPAPGKIAELCTEIRDGWTEETLRQRHVGPLESEPIETPVISLREIDIADVPIFMLTFEPRVSRTFYRSPRNVTR